VVGASYVHCSPDCRDMLTMVRYLSNGELDHSFGKAGKVQFFTGGLFPEGSGLQSDGDIVVATSRAFDTSGCPDTIVASLIRFRPNGRLDTSFGSHGQVPVTTTDPKALAIRPNDGIVLGGWVCPALRAHLSVSVFGKDGAIDASFGADGTATVVVGPTDALAYVVGEQPDGKILAAGVTYRDIDHSSFAVVRFLAP